MYSHFFKIREVPFPTNRNSSPEINLVMKTFAYHHQWHDRATARGEVKGSVPVTTHTGHPIQMMTTVMTMKSIMTTRIRAARTILYLCFSRYRVRYTLSVASRALRVLLSVGVVRSNERQVSQVVRSEPSLVPWATRAKRGNFCLVVCFL